MRIKLKEENSEKEIDVEDGSTVEEVLREEGKNPSEVLTAVNGTITSKKHELKDRDEVELLEVIAGG